MNWKPRFLFTVLLVCVSFLAVAQKIPQRPNPPRLVNDLADVLSAAEEQQLERQLVSYDDTTSNQVAIVLINTLNDYPIEEYALQLFREWGIGNKTTNNGVLILAAVRDRKLRIEVGYGLEGAIPDITANHIIQGDIAPNFRRGDYYEGLSVAANSIIKASAGEYQAPEGYGNRGKKARRVAPIGLIILAIIFIILFSGRNRGGGGGGFMSRRGYRGGWLGPFLIGTMLGRGSSGGGGWGGGGGGFGGGGFGGGGFGGFGGGSSGGGGASGSW